MAVAGASDGIPGTVLTPPKQLQSLGGLNGLLEQIRQRFGDTTGYSLTIYPEYAVLSRADPTDERRKLSYTYRGGFDDPSTKAGVIVDWLKEDFGLGRGHAMALVHVIKNGAQIGEKHVGTGGSAPP